MSWTAHRTLLASPPRTVIILRLLAVLVVGQSATTWAAEWTVVTGISAQETYTDNVRLEPKSQAESDLVSDIAPYIQLHGEGARLKLDFIYSPHLLLYANNPEQDGVSHSLNARSKAELVENLFFLDADARVAQDFVSPFGSTQSDLSTINQNRVETYSARLSPYLKGNFGPDLTWQARNDTTWNAVSGNAYGDSQQINWSASLQTPVRLFGSRTEFQRNELHADQQPTRVEDVARTYLYFRPITSITFSAIGGYEQNNYSLQETKNAIYGAGIDWNPSPLDSASATWEHRYFGSSYQVALNHRTRLTAWNITASRGASSYPQELLNLPPGNTAALLDTLLTSRFPDPAEREAAVQDIIRRTGLPPFLAAQQTVFTQQIFLFEREQASFAILGVRNTLTFTAFRTTEQQITEQLAVDIGDALATSEQITTRGFSAALAHSLTGFSTITGVYFHSRSESNLNASASTQDRFDLRWTHRLSPKTNVFTAARYVRFNSEGTTFAGYEERAVLAGIDHIF
jgi:uncharacterized protein (PEP-CTERM system associated)